MTSKIKFINGHNNILLIAPHGHPKNDMNTGELATQMAEILGCYAVINEHYRRPYTDKETKKFYGTNKKEGIVDLNYIPDIKSAGMEGEFLQLIFDVKKTILAKDGNDDVFIIHIHGIGDHRYKKSGDIKPPVLVGIGKHKNQDRLSATVDTAERIIKIMGENGTHPILARIEQGGGYSGWANHNLNQLFTGFVDKKYKDDKVQSIQLEIKFTGFRDMDNLDKTADVLSSALRDIAGLKEEDKKEELLQQSPEKAVVPAAGQEKLLESAEIKSTDAERQLSENKEMVAIAQIVPSPVEEQPDETLIEEAYSKLAGIFFSHYQNALLEAGQYIIDTFFDGKIELARQKKPVKEISYTQLIKRLQERKGDSPKKSWLFNAVNLIIQEHDFASVQALGQLKTTQKLLLLPVHDPVLKQKLAEESVGKDYTYRQFIEAINKTKTKRSPTLQSYLNKPEKLFSNEYSHVYSNDALAEMKAEQIETIKESIAKETQKLQAYLQQYQSLLDRLDKLKKSEKTVKTSGLGI